MAFSDRMHGSLYLIRECVVEINAAVSHCRSKIAVADAKGLGIRRRHGLYQKDAVFSVLKVGMGNDCGGRWKKNNVIVRSHLKPPVHDDRDKGESKGNPKAENLLEGGYTKFAKDPDAEKPPVPDDGGSNGGAGNGGRGDPPQGSGGGGSGNSRESGDDDEEAKEFGPFLSFKEVMRMVEARGSTLPHDMYEAAKTTGIRKAILENFLDLQADPWIVGFLMKHFPQFRNRMLVDRNFAFKLLAEIAIDTGCATIAEIKQRGEKFWSERELFLIDLLVGLVVNVALVGMLARYARFGQASTSSGFYGQMSRAYGALPSSVFEAGSFSSQQRAATYVCKGVLYLPLGFACGLIGQGLGNLWMTANRRGKSEDDVPVPPLIKSAALWGVFLAVSSNTRYQMVNLLERIVEGSAVAKHYPPAARAFTVGLRLSNNIIGGMQFVDWARKSGCQ